MNLSISDLRNIAPESIWLEITPADRLRVQEEIDRCHHSNQTAKNHARLNRLSLYALQSWFESQQYEFASQIELFPSADGLPWIWEIVNGTAFNIGATRLVIIPSNFTDTEELIVPQEWMDIPSWMSHYYLAVQVDEDNGRICVWGYISHDEIKNIGEYDDIYHNYHIDREDLHFDLELLWMDCQINTPVELEREPLPQIDETKSQQLLAKIATPTIFSPRLDLSFPDLATILDSSKYLKEIYAKRNNLVPAQVVTKLSNWIRSQVDLVEDISTTLADETWLTLNKFWDKPAPLAGFLNEKPNPKIAPNTYEAIDLAVNNLYADQSPNTKVALPSNINSPQHKLLYLMQHTADQTLRWKAAEYLWTIEPDNSENWHRRIKDLRLVMQEYKLGLMVAIIPLLNGKYAVLNRVYPIGNEKYLPPKIELTLLSKNQQRAQTISRSEEQDSCIQLYFTGSVGYRFNICICMKNTSVTEAFEI